MADAQRLLTLEPQEVVFTGVRLHQVRPSSGRLRACSQVLISQGSEAASTRPSCGCVQADSILMCRLADTILMYRLDVQTSARGGRACAQAYTQTVVVTNHLRATVEASIRAGSPERYALAPAALTLRPGQSAAVDVVLRVLKFAARKKAAQVGQRDIFHIKARPCPLSGLQSSTALNARTATVQAPFSRIAQAMDGRHTCEARTRRSLPDATSCQGRGSSDAGTRRWTPDNRLAGQGQL